MLRLDCIDPLISGNKWFVTEHLAQARRAGATGVISLGGAYSNHLHALAAAGKRFVFHGRPLLRGHPQDTPTVFDLKALGMQLHWLGYGGYGRGMKRVSGCLGASSILAFIRYPKAAGLAGARGCGVLVEQARAQLGNLG